MFDCDEWAVVQDFLASMQGCLPTLRAGGGQGSC